MHNMDRTTLETSEHEYEQEGEFGNLEMGELASEQEGEYEGEWEQEGEQEGEYEGEWEQEGEYEGEWELEGEQEGEHEHESSSPFHEAEAMELASELLAVSSEQELNYFFKSKFLKGALKRARKFAKSKLGRTLIGGLKVVAKKALPVAGAALGNLIVPGAGGVVGATLARRAGKMLGLELEGLSAEDREFEVAKQFVHFAGAAMRNAARRPCGPIPSVARNALVKAAKLHAPGLAPSLSKARIVPAGAAMPRGRSIARPGAPSPARSAVSSVGVTSGRWERRGKTIVLIGV